MRCAALDAGSSAAWRVVLAARLSVLERTDALLGQCAAVARLTGSLFVGSSAIRFRLDWTPKFSMEAGLAAAVAST